jgi:predicted nucleic acid-binding protein
VIVVSDTSPIRALHFLDLIPVLGNLFDQVLVPPAVQHELASPPLRFEPIDLSGHSFIEFRAPQDAAQVLVFRQSLDAGESEALALAIEIGAEAILIDEMAGRIIAARHRLRAFGALGILLQAKRAGHIEQVRPLVDKLIDELDFYVAEDLKQDVLRLAGE